MRDFLQNCPEKHWCCAFFSGRRYGEMYSNAAESFNAWIKEARYLPIAQLVETIQIKMMNQISRRCQESNKWTMILCPEMNKRLNELLAIGRGWNVTRSSEFIFQVHSEKAKTVNLLDRACSCFKWQLSGFPCSHALVAIQSNGQDIF